MVARVCRRDRQDTDPTNIVECKAGLRSMLSDPRFLGALGSMLGVLKGESARQSTFQAMLF